MAKGVAPKVDLVLQELLTRLTNLRITRGVKKEVQFFDAEGCRMSIFNGNIEELLGYTDWAAFLFDNDICGVLFPTRTSTLSMVNEYRKDTSNTWHRDSSDGGLRDEEEAEEEDDPMNEAETTYVISIDGRIKDRVFNTLDAAKAAGKAAIENIEPDEEDEDATIEIEVKIFQLITTLHIKKEVVVTVIEEN